MKAAVQRAGPRARDPAAETLSVVLQATHDTVRMQKSLEQQGKQLTLATLVDAGVEVAMRIHGESRPREDLVAMENEHRAGLKDITDGQPMEVPRVAAIEILDRALENHWKLTGNDSPNTRRFMEAAYAVA